MSKLVSVFAALAVAVAIRVSLSGAAADPRITFEYSPLIDNPCYAAVGQERDAAVVDETSKHVADWREQWERDAPDLFATVVKLTGQPFKFHEAKAALFSCPAFPSMSLPFMFQVRPALRATATDARAGAQFFSRMVFHEVLHRYVADRIAELPGETTPLLDKYKAEAPAVRSHLHNVALMEEVYKALGRDADVAANRQAGPARGAVAGVRGAGDAARYLEIIATEQSAVLVKELRRR